jgi:hypothetical protein
MSPNVQTDALSDIDINSPPAINREPKIPFKNILKRIKCRLSNFYLSKQKMTPMTSTTHQNKSILM